MREWTLSCSLTFPTHTHHGTDAHSQHTDTNTIKIIKDLTLALPSSLNLLNDDLPFLILYLKYFVPCAIFLLCLGFLRAREIAVHNLGLWLQLGQGYPINCFLCDWFIPNQAECGVQCFEWWEILFWSCLIKIGIADSSVLCWKMAS